MITGFIALILLRYAYILILAALDCHGFIIGDWLINFQAGFVRRGLSGSIILWLSDLLSVKPNIMTFCLQIFFYAGYLVVLWLLFCRKEVTIWFLILLLSPATLLFPIYDPGAIGRKEILLFLLFGTYLLLLNKKKLKSFYSNILFSILILLSTMCHELVFFYLPYFVIASFIKSNLDGDPFLFGKAALVVIGGFLVMIPLFLYGKTINNSIICSGLLEKGLSENICTGTLKWQSNFGIKEVYAFAMQSGYPYTYGLCLLLGLTPFIFFVNSVKNSFVTMKRFFIALFFLFLFSAPLFVIAIDWGRWLNIHFMLLLFLSTLLLKDSPSASWFPYMKLNLSLPNISGSKSCTYKLVQNFLFIIIIGAYLTLWSMHHYGFFSVFSLKIYSVENSIYKIINCVF